MIMRMALNLVVLLFSLLSVCAFSSTSPYTVDHVQLTSAHSGTTVTLVLAEHTVTGEVLAVLPEQGASLEALILKQEGELVSVLRGNWPLAYNLAKNVTLFKNLLRGNAPQADVDFLVDNMVNNKVFKNRQLIPWPNRLADHVYTFPYGSENVFECPANELPSRNDSLHGLLYNKNLPLQDVVFGSDSVQLKFQYKFTSSEAQEQVFKKCYPFDVLTELVYTLGRNSFKVKVTATNLESKRIVPFGAGVHFYFNVESIPNAAITFDRSQPNSFWNRIEVDKQTLMPTEEYTLFDLFHGEPIGATSYDTGFSGNNLDRLQSIKTIIDVSKSVRVQMESDSQWRWLQVFTGLDDRSAIAIEPMSVPINAFKDGRATFLEAGSTWSGEYGISLLSSS